MGYRPQTGSRRSAGQRYQKSQHEKAKAKAQKHRSSGKYLIEEEHVPTSEEIVEKAISRLHSLGNQKFALSPFSSYFDDWLLNLKEVMSEFESNPTITVDDEFVKERSIVLANVEQELAERRRMETVIEEVARSLADSSHLLVQIDEEYASSTRKLASRRNSEIQRLTRNVHDLEAELDRIRQIKSRIFGSFSKKAKAQKEAEITQKIDSVKNELESVVHSFSVEQERLHDEYEKRKQSVIEKVQNLEKEVERSETDGSQEVRRATCEAFVSAVKALQQRKTTTFQ